MKILYITPFEPSLKSGGGRHCYANVRALCLYPGALVDYIGPVIEEALPDLQPAIFQRQLARPFTIIDKAKAALWSDATSLVSLFSEFVRQHDVTKYDLVFIETTRCGFVFREIGMQIRTICCVHNVEADYLGFNKSGGTRLAARNIRQSEQKTLHDCSTLLVMHVEDEQRLREIYSVDEEATRFMRHPVCSLAPKMKPIPYENRERGLIFAGSLDSKFNDTGLREFLLHCWPTLKDAGYPLVVAGRNPSRDLAQFITRQPSVRLIANPPEMGTLLRNARLLILPDITGTGMKLRVAEAMSLGIPVVGTRLGLRGYEEISQFGQAVESMNDMQDAILKLLADESRLASCAKAAREIWEEQYSIDTFTLRLHRYLDDLLH